MSVVVHISGRAAIPVRAVVLVTLGNVSEVDLASELAKSDRERRITAYRYRDGKVDSIKPDAWAMQQELLGSVVRAHKSKESNLDNPNRDIYREAVWRESLEKLPPATFVWLDEFERWYASSYISPETTWAEIHGVHSEDDADPKFDPVLPNPLDLDPIALTDLLPKILEGFGQEAEGNVEDVADVAEAGVLNFQEIATRDQLIDAFGLRTGMNMSWFRKLEGALLGARVQAGSGGRGHITEPYFCPFKVMNWLAKKPRKGAIRRRLDEKVAWDLLERHFPAVYNRYSVADPREK